MPKSYIYSHNTKFLELEETAVILRELVIKMLLRAGSGHSAGSLGMADVFAALYFEILNIDPKKPHQPDHHQPRGPLSREHPSHLRCFFF